MAHSTGPSILRSMKLPLYMHSPHLCDPEFKDTHTYLIMSGLVTTANIGCLRPSVWR